MTCGGSYFPMYFEAYPLYLKMIIFTRKKVILSQNIFSNISLYHKKAPKKHQPLKNNDLFFMMICPDEIVISKENLSCVNCGR